MSQDVFSTYKVHEVVGVFHDADKAEAAVDTLVDKGFSPAAISFMGAAEAIAGKLGNVYEPVAEMEDDPRVPQKAFVSKSHLRMGEAAVIGAPLYLTAMAGSLAVLATGGSVALVLAAAAAGGTVGGGIGAVLARAMDKHHAEKLEKDIEAGGFLLWVHVADAGEQQKAIDVLTGAGAEGVHAHEIERTWGTEDVPLSDFNPDPFLEKDAD